MDGRKFESIAKETVANYYDAVLLADGRADGDGPITKENVIVVWSAKVLQNNKAMLITDTFGPHYFEVTYNGEKNELYLDDYVKSRNARYPLIPNDAQSRD